MVSIAETNGQSEGLLATEFTRAAEENVDDVDEAEIVIGSGSGALILLHQT